MLGRNTTSALQELRRSGAWSLVLRNEDGTFNQCVWTQIRRLLLFELPDLLEHAAIARDLFRHNRVAIVLSGDVNDARSRVYCLSAKQFGVPSLEVQFGMYGSEAVEWQFFDADRVAVWGEHARLVMESHGIPADRIAVTGSPRHDVVSEWRKPTMRAALLKRFHCGDDTKVIVFAPSYSGLNDQVKFFNVVDAVCRAASVEERLLLIIKPHPGERSNEVARIASVYDRVRIGAAGDDVRDLIGGCDAFVTMGTTATMEALLAEVPVIWPNLDSLAWWEDTFMRSGAVITVTSEIELRRVFTAVAEGTIEERAAWSEQKRRLFVEAWTYAADGGASSRIANLAKSMAGTL